MLFRSVQLDPDTVDDDEDVSRRAAAASPHRPWKRRSPSSGREVANLGSGEPPPCTRRHRRFAPTHQHLQIDFARLRRTSDTGEGTLAPQLHGPASKTRTGDPRQSSPEHRHRRGRPPPHNTTPTPPPPPQRRRQEAYSNLDYIHDEIRGSPTLPPPERPPEGEGSGDPPPASWFDKRVPENHPLSTVAGRG